MFQETGSDQFDTLFHTQKAQFDSRTLSCTLRFAPVVVSNFRLLIERSAASVTPQSWVAELAQMQVFGVNATNPAETSVSVSSGRGPADLGSGLQSTGFVPRVIDQGQPWTSTRRGIGWCWTSRAREY